MTGSQPEGRSDGKAAVSIRITEEGVQSARTVRPAGVALADVTAWRLRGGKQGEEETLLAEFSSHQSQTIALDTGTWRFTLTGYKEDDAILAGSITEQTIGEGSNTLSFTVAPLLQGEGAISIAIELPAGSGITAARVFVDGADIDYSVSPVNDRIALEASYDAGVYYFSVRLYKGEDLYGVVSEIVYVWANLTSEKTYTLVQEDLNSTYIITYHSGGETETGYYRYTDANITLAAPSPREGYAFNGWYDNADLSGSAVAVIPAGSLGNKDFYARWTEFVETPSNLSLAQSLAWINANAEEGGAYTIILRKDEEFIEPQTLSYTAGTVHITLDGGAMKRTVGLLTATGSLFTVENGVTLTLGNNVTLQGVGDNTNELARVNSGGTLVMESGSKITGNSNSSSGGGVIVSGGTFTMSGGEISGNSSSSSGGGVYVGGSFGSYGTFTMNGGEISGNSSSSGGGVYVSSSGSYGTFTMNGGEISGNSSSSGGGVYVYYNGTFTMSGGEISGNSSSYSGGGVYVSSGGTFTKQSGGVIYGSNASGGLKNTATEGYSYGHAVYIDSSPVKIRNATADSGVILDGAASGAAGGWETSLSSALSLAQSLTWINNNAVEGGAYSITVSADESVAPAALSYSGKKVSVTLDGGSAERTVSLNSNGALFTIGGGATLTLGNNITLQGRSGNTASLVRVNSGGTLIMSGGSKIAGNSNASSSGGGVSVDNGTFTMSGGAISGNSSSFGGGVYVYSGTFTMSGGEISDNSSSSGGGVYAGGSGTFAKQGGGIIYGSDADDGVKNTAANGDNYGHAVYIDSSPARIRTSTADDGVALDSAAGGDAGGWESNIYAITYSSVSGGTWTLQDDGRRRSPATSDNSATKARVSFTSKTADASIIILLAVSSESGYDYAFIGELDNASAAYNSGFYPGSVISGETSVTITIPVSSSGDHFIDIGYRKDPASSSGSDCAWFKVIE
jgi:uncharacterized repeat protein (TIGR02543 family)